MRAGGGRGGRREGRMERGEELNTCRHTYTGPRSLSSVQH